MQIVHTLVTNGIGFGGQPASHATGGFAVYRLIFEVVLYCGLEVSFKEMRFGTGATCL